MNNKNNSTPSGSESQVMRTFRWQTAQLQDPTLQKLGRIKDCDIIRTSLGFASFHTENCFVSAEEVAERINFSVNTVKEHRAELIRLGWWTVTSRTSRRVTMRISFPEELSRTAMRPADSPQCDQTLLDASSYSKVKDFSNYSSNYSDYSASEPPASAAAQDAGNAPQAPRVVKTSDPLQRSQGIVKGSLPGVAPSDAMEKKEEQPACEDCHKPYHGRWACELADTFYKMFPR